MLIFSSSYGQSNKINIGNVEKIYSKILKEERRIWVYNPGEIKPKTNPDRYPVLYLLDAEDHFYATVGIIKQMSGRWPEMIVVGITNTNRNRDLTPTSVDNGGMTGINSGGGENFLNFIGKELMPHIDSIYPTSSYRLLSGHSLGGLTVVNALINHTNLFKAYIAIDPSLWWDDQKLLKQSQKDLSTKTFDNISLFIGRANNMPPTMDTITALKDSSTFTSVFRSTTKFVSALKQSSLNGLRWGSKFYPEESHGTVELNAEYDALKFIFNYYQFRTSLFEFNPNMNIDSALIAHFENISKNFGYKVLPSKDLVNSLGYTCLTLKKWDKALTFFKLNIQNYPQDANGYDSIGDYYEAAGDHKKAIDSYTKALTLGNDPDTKRKLEVLQSQKLK